MRGLALVLCALVLLASPARADVAVLGSAPAAPDAGAPLDVPVELQAGQPAPFHGYELSDARAEQLLANQQATAPAETSSAPLVVAVVAFVAGALLGGYVVAKVK